MMLFVKLSSQDGIALPEIMFWRQMMALPVIAAWVAATAGLHTLKTQRLPLHARRAAMGLTGMVMNFGSVILLPLAESTTIGFTVPLFATMFSALLLKERVGIHRWSAVALGFAGVLVITQPGASSFPLMGAAVGIGAAIMVALISIQVRELARVEAAATVAFWFSALSVLPLALLLPWFAVAHTPHHWLLLAGTGIVGALGQIMLTASLRYAPVSTVAGMDYSGLIWATLWGWLVWDQLPSSATWLGAPLIIASGLYIVWREHRLALANRAAAAAESAV